MEKSLYIHLGPAKTGTTAIQSFLSLNKTALSKKGFHYLNTFRFGNMHHPLAWMLIHKYSRNYSNIGGKPFFGKLEKTRLKLELELNSISDKSIIISSEFLQFLSKEAIDELISLFPDRPVKAIFYIRDISSQSVSLASQVIKWQDTMNEVAITNLHTHIINFYNSYARCLDMWDNKIGKENIIFRKYGEEYFKHGNIYADCLNSLGIEFTDDFILPDKMQNQSLIYCETIYFKDLLNKLNLGTFQSILVEQMISWEKKNCGTKFFLPENSLQKIEKVTKKTCKYLLDNYLDESFVKLFHKKPLVNKSGEYTLSHVDFTNLLDYMDSHINGFKNEFHKCMLKTLDRTFIYELKLRENEETLNNVIKYKNAIAVWGCGDFAEGLFRNHEFLKDERFYVVDNNIEKQGTIFWGHKVLSPVVISEKGIDTVIITSVAYANDIYQDIRSKYQNVKKIIKVSGLHINIGIECIDC